MKNKFTLGEIEDAWCGTVGDLKKTIAELTRAEPEFIRNQIVMVSQHHNALWYPRRFTENVCGEQVREPNLAELGRLGQHVRDLRDAVYKWESSMDGWKESLSPYEKEMRAALARFDAAVKDE